MLSQRLVPLLARQRFQRGFEWLHLQAVRGLGYGNGDPATNGEYRLLDTLAPGWGETPVVFDVGAAEGQWTRAVLARVPKARVFSVEPRATGLPEGAVHLPLALGVEAGTATLYGAGEMSSLTERDYADFEGFDTSSTLEIQVRRLDDVCREQGVARIEMLKIDAEGHDLDVLVGAGDLLRPETIGAIQFEFGGTHIDTRTFVRDFRRLLNPAGYEIYRVVRDGWVPLLSPELTEIFSYGNLLALPR